MSRRSQTKSIFPRERPKFCIHCGARSEPGWKFCVDCARRIGG